jgi:hypothetical membrane protein
MSKTIIAPIVGFLVVLVKLVFGIELADDIVNQVIDTSVTVASLGLVLIGIFKNHKKKPTD